MFLKTSLALALVAVLPLAARAQDAGSTWTLQEENASIPRSS